jgi:dimethylaniline monooxygenase (N-oxide forming)
MNSTQSLRVAVIGAGASGLCMAKHLIEAGVDVTVFEIGSQIGGQWVYNNDSGKSPAYRTLHINSPKSLTAFPDFAFPEKTQLFPSHWDMHKYLVAYADKFGVTPRIRLRSEVKALRPLFRPGVDLPLWEIELMDGRHEKFDHVVCASGHLTKPKHAAELRDAFKGEYLHSCDYRDPADFVRKRVCVVGVGNSAVDIASDLCVTSPLTVLVARTGVMIVPKLLMGVSVAEYLVKLYQPWMPGIVLGWVGGFITWLAHGKMAQYGFKPVTRATHTTTSSTLITHIAYNRIKVKQGIERIKGKRIYFVDGTSDEFDTLIGATGYLVDFPFLSSGIPPIGEDNKVDLYKKMAAPGWPGLWFIGMVNTTTALNRMFQNQAAWIREFILGNAVLPNDSDMRADIEAKRAYINGKYLNTSRHALEEEHATYFVELRAAMKNARRQAGRRSLGRLDTQEYSKAKSR